LVFPIIYAAHRFEQCSAHDEQPPSALGPAGDGVDVLDLDAAAVQPARSAGCLAKGGRQVVALARKPAVWPEKLAGASLVVRNIDHGFLLHGDYLPVLEDVSFQVEHLRRLRSRRGQRSLTRAIIRDLKRADDENGAQQ
jgi:hypothetical protein